MNTKTYIKYLLGAIAVFVSYHLLMWVFFTSKIFGLDDKTTIGDLARMSYQIDMIDKKILNYSLPKSFIYNQTFKDQKIDIITIGDSFSHAACGGKNPYYQDFLASMYNQNVLNVNPIDSYKFIETVVGLYNSGYLKSHKPKYILIQSVERFCMPRFKNTIHYIDYNLSQPTISKKIFTVQHQDIPLINTGNYKLPYFYIAYKFLENPKKDVHKFKLNKKLFSNTDSILIFHDDIKNIPQFTKESVTKLNANFNKLAKLLAQEHIKLIFMPTSDKYDLYYNYLEKNKHPKNPFFDLLRPLKKEYIFIDTKAILEPYLSKGEQGLYYQDDTHWSSRASEAIAKSKTFLELLGK